MTPSQCVIRKPLLTLWELHTTGTYLKGHQTRNLVPPERFTGFYEDYKEFVEELGNAKSTVDMKLGRMRRFLEHLAEAVCAAVVKTRALALRGRNG